MTVWRLCYLAMDLRDQDWTGLLWDTRLGIGMG